MTTHLDMDIALMLPHNIPEVGDIIQEHALRDVTDDEFVPGDLHELCNEFRTLWTKMNGLLNRRMAHWETGAHWPNILRANEKLFAAVNKIHEAARAYREGDALGGNLAYLDAEQWLQDADDELGDAEAIGRDNMRPPTLHGEIAQP